MGACRCGMPEWRTLRRALTLIQVPLAEVLGMSRRGVRTGERPRPPPRCPRRATLRALQLSLQTDHVPVLLARTEDSHPLARPPTVPLPREPKSPGESPGESPGGEALPPHLLQLRESVRSLDERSKGGR